MCDSSDYEGRKRAPPGGGTPLAAALFQGYRIAERPIVMHKRAAGESKKGHNVLYGARYARVILGTWWRERRR